MSQISRQPAKSYNNLQRLITPRPAEGTIKFIWENKVRSLFANKDCKYSSYDAEAVDKLFIYNKTHKDLMDRYFSQSEMTQAERVEKSAKRVGLTVPEYLNPTTESK